MVSEAFGGAAGASALSSYDVSESGELEVVSASVGTSQTAACWLVITGDSRFAYTTNTGSGTISGYRLSPDGALTLLAANGVSGTTGAGPIDMALGDNDRFLYALNSGGGTISAFQVNADGSLTPQPGADSRQEPTGWPPGNRPRSKCWTWAQPVPASTQGASPAHDGLCRRSRESDPLHVGS